MRYICPVCDKNFTPNGRCSRCGAAQNTLCNCIKVSKLKCTDCALNQHRWIYNLRLTAQMLAGEIKLPHSIGACFECGKARLMQIAYQEELQSRKPDLQEYIEPLSQLLGASRITIEGVSYVWDVGLNQWLSEARQMQNTSNDLKQIISGSVERTKHGKKLDTKI